MPLFYLALALLLIAAAPARAAEGCQAAIAAEEAAAGDMPAGLLGAIGRVESGRRDRATGAVAPWPWSVNAEGQDYVFETREEAIAWVAAARARGMRSIDVGCMQVNLMYHPDAFANLEEAFAPEANVRYAASFLHRLRQETGDWTAAAGRYHSATTELAQPYIRQVMAAMGQGAALGAVLGQGPTAMTIRPAVFALPPRAPDAVAVLLAANARLVRVFSPGSADTPAGGPRLPRVYRP
jgi:hypothetical protein